MLDRVPVDDITERARQVDFSRVLLTLLALIPFLVGWLAGSLFMAVAWTGAAVKAGWMQARQRDLASG